MNKVVVHLSSPAWRRAGSTGLSVRGHVYSVEGMPLATEQLAGCPVACVTDLHACSDAMRRIEGFFALVRVMEGRVIAAVDHLRSIPLFYGVANGSAYVSDDAEWVRNAVGNKEMDPLARDEFKLTGYVTGSQTLYPDVKELQAGELLLVDTTQGRPVVATARYFQYDHFPSVQADEGLLREKLDERLHAAVHRLAAWAGGRQIVIPLSGGYDSRLVATLLCRIGYPNMLAFTYGVPGNKEAEYSRQVAQALGLKWHFVEYSRARWRAAWNSAERRRYQDFASGWSSLAHVQDWLAVRSMQEDGVLEQGCVFVPGHTCFRQNTGITARDDISTPPGIELFIDRIRDRHYIRSVGKDGPERHLPVWRQRIRETAGVDKVASWEALANAYERWEWQERQAKFICNSVRVYEFFGYDWWLPLWDMGLVRFAQGVPLHLRQGRRWYNEYVRQLYAAHVGVPVEETLRNAEETSIAGIQVRRLLTGLPRPFQVWAKAMRNAIRARQQRNAYIVSHLPEHEVRRLLREGYRIDGMLVHEFLNARREDVRT
ncbi:MAG TPA: asparagine synthetase B family protein [Noviherbaspirillum sp.]|nr:asparagine synthetase B family protein [Noviherbaspirillum sp.]